MDYLHKGWFTEAHATELPGQAFSLEVEEVLYHEKSKFQDILVFKSKKYGRVLVLDDSIQCTEKDEFSYHEIIAHLPLFSHPNPKTVLVVGGGDGGVLREVAKHSTVEEIHICEIDESVIEVSKKYLPFTGVGFSNPKVKVHIADGIQFLKDCQGCFDVIITDASDPVGFGKPLYEKPYFESLREALKPDGIMCSIGDTVWIDIGLVKRMTVALHAVFPVIGYAFTTVPAYPGGMIGFFLASLNERTVFKEPLRKLSDEDVEKLQLKYYNSNVHKAAFVLPQFAKEAIQLSMNPKCK